MKSVACEIRSKYLLAANISGSTIVLFRFCRMRLSGLDSSCIENATANISTDSEAKTIITKQPLLAECINLQATPRTSYIKLSLSPIYISHPAKILSSKPHILQSDQQNQKSSITSTFFHTHSKCTSPTPPRLPLRSSPPSHSQRPLPSLAGSR